ncbi:hypothetical protein PCE1_003419 [Barthelona sp. PCE]
MPCSTLNQRVHVPENRMVGFIGFPITVLTTENSNKTFNLTLLLANPNHNLTLKVNSIGTYYLSPKVAGSYDVGLVLPNGETCMQEAVTVIDPYFTHALTLAIPLFFIMAMFAVVEFSEERQSHLYVFCYSIRRFMLFVLDAWIFTFVLIISMGSIFKNAATLKTNLFITMTKFFNFFPDASGQILLNMLHFAFKLFDKSKDFAENYMLINWIVLLLLLFLSIAFIIFWMRLVSIPYHRSSFKVTFKLLVLRLAMFSSYSIMVLIYSNSTHMFEKALLQVLGITLFLVIYFVQMVWMPVLNRKVILEELPELERRILVIHDFYVDTETKDLFTIQNINRIAAKIDYAVDFTQTTIKQKFKMSERTAELSRNQLKSLFGIPSNNDLRILKYLRELILLRRFRKHHNLRNAPVGMDQITYLEVKALRRMIMDFEAQHQRFQSVFFYFTPIYLFRLFHSIACRLGRAAVGGKLFIHNVIDPKASRGLGLNSKFFQSRTIFFMSLCFLIVEFFVVFSFFVQSDFALVIVFLYNLMWIIPTVVAVKEHKKQTLSSWSSFVALHQDLKTSAGLAAVSVIQRSSSFLDSYLRVSGSEHHSPTTSRPASRLESIADEVHWAEGEDWSIGSASEMSDINPEVVEVAENLATTLGWHDEGTVKELAHGLQRSSSRLSDRIDETGRSYEIGECAVEFEEFLQTMHTNRSNVSECAYDSDLSYTGTGFTINSDIESDFNFSDIM